MRVGSLGREDRDCFCVILDWGLVGWVLWVLNLKLLFKELGILVFVGVRSEILGFIIKLHSPKLWPLPSYPKPHDLWMANFWLLYTLFYKGLSLSQLLSPALTLVFCKIRIHQTCSQMDSFSDTPNIAHYNTYLDSIYTPGSHEHMIREANQHIPRCPADQD